MRTLLIFALTSLAMANRVYVLDQIEKQILDIADIPYQKTRFIKERKGPSKIEIMKQKVRDEIAKKKGIDPKTINDRNSLIEAQKKAIREKIKNNQKQKTSPNSLSWIEKKLIEEKKFMDTNQKSIDEFIKKYNKARSIYNDNKKIYIKSLTDIPHDYKEEIIIKEIKEKITLDKKIIRGAFDVKIKDQGERPTCSAFAAIHALEILLYQKGYSKDLSEQYFYWSSKPKCQKNLCSKGGSWVGHGIERSNQSSSPNIPLEKSCPYKTIDSQDNDTQIPLRPGCFEGYVKVKKYEVTRNLNDIINALNKDQPVIAGTKLDGTFFDNKGTVFKHHKAKENYGTNKHSKGHAYTIIGYLKLPKKIHHLEGKVCFLVANSWNIGWGLGGRACVAQKWIESHLNKSPFIIVQNIKI